MKWTAGAWGRLFPGKSAYAISALCVTMAAAATAQTFTTLHTFDGTDGGGSWAAVVQGVDGALYGTTYNGGSGGGGTVFKITPAGTLTTVYNFCSLSRCADGALPQGRLGETANGDFYSTTTAGGQGNCPRGCGTIYRVRSGKLTTLDSFNNTNGADPADGLVPATNGYLYGTTVQGGANTCSSTTGCGTVFRITPSGALTNMHSFAGSDGRQIYARLVQATDGDIYGTTYAGGSNACLWGCGTVYKITPNGTLTTLHNFNGADGSSPVGGLIQAADGNLYGETKMGGTQNSGTVFRITPDGALTTIYNFCSQTNCADGWGPPADMVQAMDGNFYGTTAAGGTGGRGTIFRLSPSGALTTLYNFCSQSGCPDGADPEGGLTQATNGDLYGTTRLGGASNRGTVFSLSVGLGPFVKTLPIMGKAGTVVEILGNDLTDASSVTFNGTAAVFTVNSTGTGISTTVPPGATTGTVQVVTPGGTLQSNVLFTVLP
ncbi:MAG TPA: choice-of-anchor tandem repeat GloVer-containing protein [Bryobacteraceae bacterium]|nr:choice-of-anchor tandem repeat GloVer-containing protein [Bryobacteraceae bacterium]